MTNPITTGGFGTICKAIAGAKRLTGDLQASVLAPYVLPQTYTVILGKTSDACTVTTGVVRNKSEVLDPVTFPAGLTVTFGTINTGTGAFTALTAATNIGGIISRTEIAPLVAATSYVLGTVFAAQVLIPVGVIAAIGLDLDVSL